QAGADQATIDRDRAGAAIAGGAAFLGTGEAERVAQCVEHGLVRLAQKLHRLAVDGGGDVNFRHLLCSSAFGGNRNRALQENAGSLDTIDNGAALVVDRTAGGAAGLGRLLERGLVELRADERLRGALDQERGRRDGAKADTGSGADAVFHVLAYR